jgi:F-type H+-transporting ATPase subunit b
MDSLIETFHIDAKLLIAQIINFGIVFSVLYFFALKPLAKTMADRTKKIEKGLSDAKELEEKLKQAEDDYRSEISRAKKEAAQVMEKAQASAEARKKEMVDKAKEEIGRLINEEKEKIQQEKAKTLGEIRSEVAGMVEDSVKKILEGGSDKEMIQKAAKKIK